MIKKQMKESGNLVRLAQLEACYVSVLGKTVDKLFPHKPKHMNDLFVKNTAKEMANEETLQKIIDRYGENYNIAQVMCVFEQIAQITEQMLLSNYKTPIGYEEKILWNHDSKPKFKSMLKMGDNNEVAQVECYYGDEQSQVVIKYKRKGYWDVYPMPIDTFAAISLVVLQEMENLVALAHIFGNFAENLIQEEASFYQLGN